MDYTNYKIIKTVKEVKKLIRYCKQTGYASVDFETNGEPFHKTSSYPTMLGVSFQAGSGWIIPLAHFDSPFLENDQWKDVFDLFCKAIIENTSIVKIAHNLAFEYNWFKKYGYTMRGRIFDTMLAKYILNEERPHGLKELTVMYFPDYAGYEDYEGSNLPWDKKPLEGLAKYCAMDCDITLRLWFFFEKKLIDLDFYPLFRNMMMMGVRVLAESEFQGMLIDVDYLDDLVESKAKQIEDLNSSLINNKTAKRFSEELIKSRKKEAIKKLKEEISEIRKIHDNNPDDKMGSELQRFRRAKIKQIQAREEKISRYLTNQFTTKKELEMLTPVNFNSPTQMIELLFSSRYGFKFDIVKYTVDQKTKKETDRPSTDGEVLEKLGVIDKSGFIRDLLDLRSEQKLYGTYIKGMREKVSDDSCVHGRFLLHGTVTGRLCIGEDTLIKTNKGDKRIGDLIPKKEGIIETHKELKALTHKGNYKPITHYINKGHEDMFEVTLENGSIIQCTLNHKFLTPKGWYSLKDIMDNTDGTIGKELVIWK